MVFEVVQEKGELVDEITGALDIGESSSNSRRRSLSEGSRRTPFPPGLRNMSERKTTLEESGGDVISSIRCRTRADGRGGGGGLRATGCRGTPGCGNACPTLGVPCWDCPAEGAEPGQRRGGAGWRAGSAAGDGGDGGDAFAWRAWPDGVRGRSTGGTVTAVGAGRSQRTGEGAGTAPLQDFVKSCLSGQRSLFPLTLPTSVLSLLNCGRGSPSPEEGT